MGKGGGGLGGRRGVWNDSLLPPSAGDASPLLGMHLGHTRQIGHYGNSFLPQGGAFLVQKDLQMSWPLGTKPLTCCPLKAKGQGSV